MPCWGNLMAALYSALCSTTLRQMDLLFVVNSYSRDYKLDAAFFGFASNVLRSLYIINLFMNKD